MAPRQLGEEGEKRARLESLRGDRHQPGERNRRCAHCSKEVAELAQRDPALLLFLANIDLDVGRLAVGRGGERVEQGAPVERMDDVEQSGSFPGLVRLELADHVEPDVRVRQTQCWPFVVRFLDSAFAEVALPGGDQRFDLRHRAALRYRDQRDFGGIAARQFRGAGYLSADFGQAGCGITHAARYTSAMPTRQTLPKIWLMTDRRMGKALWSAIERVPRGGGVVLRHHRSELVLSKQVAETCATRGLMLAVAGDAALARSIGAAMVHNPAGEADGLLLSRSVHDVDEAQAARNADLIFVSPVFATASHPGNAGLGLERAMELARLSGVPAIALGGMDAERGEAAIRVGFYGWAAIDAWLA